MEPSVFIELIKQFGIRVGLPEMKLDDAGLCRVVLDESINLDFELSSDGQTLYVYSALPPMDVEIQNEAMKAFLASNYAFHRSGNCRFAFDENSNEFLLLETISSKGLDLELFDQILQAFARTATNWHTNCKRREFNPSASDPSGFIEPDSSSRGEQLPFV